MLPILSHNSIHTRKIMPVLQSVNWGKYKGIYKTWCKIYFLYIMKLRLKSKKSKTEEHNEYWVYVKPPNKIFSRCLTQTWTCIHSFIYIRFHAWNNYTKFLIKNLLWYFQVLYRPKSMRNFLRTSWWLKKKKLRHIYNSTKMFKLCLKKLTALPFFFYVLM